MPAFLGAAAQRELHRSEAVCTASLPVIHDLYLR